MEKENIIPARECCVHYNIEFSFIEALEQHGLISITTVDEQAYLSSEELGSLEKYIQFHYNLDVNMEGLEVISHLLERINNMHRETLQLKNRLSVYEK